MDLALLLQEASLDGRVYTNQLNYTADGRLNTRTSPGGRYMWYQPDGHGRPQQLNSGGIQWAHSAVYHPSGQLTSLQYHNTMAMTATVNARHQVTSMRYASPVQTALHDTYSYDALGRVVFIDNQIWSNPARDHAYSYDALGRLTSASGEWGAGSYSYDLLNNIRSKTLGARTVDLQYNASGRLSRYRDTGDGVAWRYQAYDARGNTTNDGLHGFTYDRSERPVSISGGATGSFVYDANGRRVKQTLDGETVYTVYGLDGTLLYRDNAATGETTDYITMGGHSVGRFDQTGTFHWIHTDHLGGAAAASRADGSVRWREHYTPFGEVQNDPAYNRNQPGFTGHIRDQATGLTYAQARYYNPVTARFLSPDPVGFASGGPGYFQRYAYTMNDPVNLVDPDGMTADPCSLNGCSGQGGRGLAQQGGAQGPTTMSSKETHAALDVAGLTPGIGIVADAANAAIYLSEGDMVGAAISGGAMIPAAGQAVGGARLAARGGDVASSAMSRVGLQRQLASQSQLSQLAEGGGTVISQPARQADRIAQEYGVARGNVQKVSSDAYIAADGRSTQTHAFRDASTNQIIEPKTIIDEP